MRKKTTEGSGEYAIPVLLHSPGIIAYGGSHVHVKINKNATGFVFVQFISHSHRSWTTSMEDCHDSRSASLDLPPQARARRENLACACRLVGV